MRSIVFDFEAQLRVLKGVDALANAVRVTLGPKGRHVLLGRSGEAPRITKDGVSVALEIELANPFENMGAELVRQVASKTAAAAGDGTTTAIVLAQAICEHGLRLVAAGHDPMELKRGLERGLRSACAALSEQSRPLCAPAELERVATLSANGDEAIGKWVAAALEQVGRDGIVSVVEGNGVDTSVDVVRGLQFARGYLSPYFITDSERIECVLEDCWVLVCDEPIRRFAALVNILEAVRASNKPLLIVAQDVNDEALTALVVNKVRGNLDCCAVKPPSLGATRVEHLRDIATVTGATVINAESGVTLERASLAHLGRCQRAVIQPDLTTLVGGGGEAARIRGRVAQLRQELAAAKGQKRTSESELLALEQRVRRLAQGVAIIKVGGHTALELSERKDRVEDSFAATRLAVEHGVVPGGGVALIRCQKALAELFRQDPNPGIEVLRRALEAPLCRIAENAGADAPVVVSTVRAGNDAFGFDASSGQYVDVRSVGIVDSTRVVEAALTCAVEVTGLMLTTRAMLARKGPRKSSFTPYRSDLLDDDEDDDY